MPSPRFTVTEDGGSGATGSAGACGVAETYQGSASGAFALVPASFPARSRKRYSRPLVSPVTTWEVVSAPAPSMAVQEPQPVSLPVSVSLWFTWYS